MIIRFAMQRQLLDHPDKILSLPTKSQFNLSLNPHSRRVHTKAVPRIGGIAIVTGFFIGTIIMPIPKNILIILIFSFFLFAIGLIDDIKPLSAKLRLLIQLTVSTFVIIYSDLSLTSLNLFSNYSITLTPIAGFLLSLFIIIGAINSINMIDGLDGLAAGVVLIGICLLSYIYYINTREYYLLIILTVPIVGAILGFLKYNTHPSSIFMGDCGSNWLGFMMGVFILLVLKNIIIVPEVNGPVLKQLKSSSLLPFLSILMCVSIPIFDTAHVIILRLVEGKNPMAPDKRHFHHSLIKIGFTHSQSVVAVYFFMVIFGLFGILPIAYPQYKFIWAPFIGCVILCICLFFIQNLSEGFITKLATYKMFLTSQQNMGPRISKLLLYWENCNRYIIYMILFAAPVFAGRVPKPLGYAAAAMSIILILSMFIKKTLTFFEAFIIAVAATILLITNNSNPIWIEIMDTKYSLQNLYNDLFICLLISTFLFFVLTFKRRYLLIVPTDFLLALFPLLLLLLPIQIQNDYKLNIIALRSLVLFAALRTLEKRQGHFFYKVHFICILALIWVALTSLLKFRIAY